MSSNVQQQQFQLSQAHKRRLIQHMQNQFVKKTSPANKLVSRNPSRGGYATSFRDSYLSSGLSHHHGAPKKEESPYPAVH
jgi:hypothetical protein